MQPSIWQFLLADFNGYLVGFSSHHEGVSDFSVERMAAGGPCFQIRSRGARRHRLPWS